MRYQERSTKIGETRLDKLVAAATGLSRRQITSLFAKGKVVLGDGAVTVCLGTECLVVKMSPAGLGAI